METVKLDTSKEAVRERVRLVAEAFINGANKTEAYRSAGFSCPTPHNAHAFFKAHKAEIEEYIFIALADKVPVAFRVLEEVMLHGKSDGARVKAATEVLDRAGITQVQKIEITNKDVSDLENKKLQDEINELLLRSGKLKLVGGTDAQS